MCGVSQGLVKAWCWLGMSWSECVAVTRDKTSPGLGWWLGLARCRWWNPMNINGPGNLHQPSQPHHLTPHTIQPYTSGNKLLHTHTE